MDNETSDKRKVGLIVAAIGICLAIAVIIWLVISHPKTDNGQANATTNHDPVTDERQAASAETTSAPDGHTDSSAASPKATNENLSEQQMNELRSALQAWTKTQGIDPTSEMEIVGSPTHTDLGMSVILHLPSSNTYLLAQLSETGSWSFTHILEQLPGVNDGALSDSLQKDPGTFDSNDAYEAIALVSQSEALSRYLPPSCATSLSSDMEAVGLSTGGAWVDVSSIENTGSTISFSVFIPTYINGGESCEIWKASWKEGAPTSFEALG